VLHNDSDKDEEEINSCHDHRGDLGRHRLFWTGVEGRKSECVREDRDGLEEARVVEELMELILGKFNGFREGCAEDGRDIQEVSMVAIHLPIHRKDLEGVELQFIAHCFRCGLPMIDEFHHVDVGIDQRILRGVGIIDKDLDWRKFHEDGHDEASLAGIVDDAAVVDEKVPGHLDGRYFLLAELDGFLEVVTGTEGGPHPLAGQWDVFLGGNRHIVPGEHKLAPVKFLNHHFFLNLDVDLFRDDRGGWRLDGGHEDVDKNKDG